MEQIALRAFGGHMTRALDSQVFGARIATVVLYVIGQRTEHYTANYAAVFTLFASPLTNSPQNTQRNTVGCLAA